MQSPSAQSIVAPELSPKQQKWYTSGGILLFVVQSREDHIWKKNQQPDHFDDNSASVQSPSAQSIVAPELSPKQQKWYTSGGSLLLVVQNCGREQPC